MEPQALLLTEVDLRGLEFSMQAARVILCSVYVRVFAPLRVVTNLLLAPLEGASVLIYALAPLPPSPSSFSLHLFRNFPVRLFVLRNLSWCMCDHVNLCARVLGSAHLRWRGRWHLGRVVEY